MASNRTWMLVTGAGIGAGMMYFFDPIRGRRRRALLRDQFHRAWSRSGNVLDTTSRNLRDRIEGIGAESRARLHEEHVSDDVLVQRVRSKMGRVVSHPHAIQVSARDGNVTLSGPVFDDEVPRLLSAVERVRGVNQVEDRLEPHRDADVPALQGGRIRPGAQMELFQRNWSPSLRLMVAAAGSGMAAYGAARGGATGLLTASAGAGMLARAVTNMDFRRMLGVDTGRETIRLQKTINIDAPVEQVYDFWSHLENFPRFMTRIKDVRNTSPGRWHWVARGPAGISMEWDAVVVREEPNHLLEWRSEPGAAVRTSGAVHFEPGESGTRVHIDFSYTPPAGALGHAFATILGADPKSAMDEDLVRLKSLLETEKTRADGRTVLREELEHR